MPLPGGLTTITVTGTYEDALGNAQAGTVTFTPNATVIDAAGHVVLTETPVVGTLSSGSFSLGPIPCTDNVLTPLGWAYTVNVAVAGAEQTFTTLLPHALGATVDITQLAPVAASPAPQGSWYLPNATTVPTSAPALGGGFLYAENGDLLWLGTGGTPETIAPSQGALPLTTLGDTLYEGPSGPARLPGNTSTGKLFLTQAGAGGGVSAPPAWAGISLSDVTTGTLAIVNGGTGQVTQQAAIDALAGSQASGQYLRGNGTHVAMSLIQLADLPAGVALLAGAAFTGAVDPAVVTLTDAATIAVNAALGNDFRVTIAASRTMGAPTGPVDGQKILFQVTQGGTGSNTITWDSAYEFSTSLAQPTLSTSAGTTDLLGFLYNATKAKWLFVASVTGFA